jgi:hypothetical protein
MLPGRTFIGEEVFSVGDQKPDRPRVRLIDVGKVDLVQYSTADCEPDAASGRRGRAYQRFDTEALGRLSPGFPVARTGVFGRVASCFSISLSTMSP